MTIPRYRSATITFAGVDFEIGSLGDMLIKGSTVEAEAHEVERVASWPTGFDFESRPCGCAETVTHLAHGEDVTRISKCKDHE
jgi:hypothetical protein